MDDDADSVPPPSVFKPVLPPILILAADATFAIIGNVLPAWVLGLVWGVSMTWLVIAAVAVRPRIARKWPWLRDWIPFVDPGGSLASEAELRSTYIRGKAFRLADLASFDGFIHDRTFEDCILYGPGVICAIGYTNNMHPRFTALPENMHWQVWRPGTRPVGAIYTREVTFKRCRFIGLGFVGTEDSIQKTYQEIAKAGSSKLAVDGTTDSTIFVAPLTGGADTRVDGAFS